jgi:hypothetical protein
VPRFSLEKAEALLPHLMRAAAQLAATLPD